LGKFLATQFKQKKKTLSFKHINHFFKKKKKNTIIINKKTKRRNLTLVVVPKDEQVTILKAKFSGAI